MATLTLSRPALEALAEWNLGERGRGIARPTKRNPDGTFGVWIDQEVVDRLERIRAPGESDDALIFRLIGSPGQGRPQ